MCMTLSLVAFVKACSNSISKCQTQISNLKQTIEHSEKPWFCHITTFDDEHKTKMKNKNKNHNNNPQNKHKKKEPDSLR